MATMNLCFALTLVSVALFMCLDISTATVVANVTAGGFTFKVNLSSPALLQELNIKRSNFRHDFFFGAGTAAAQTEGSSKEGGRGPSVWDHRVKILPDATKDSGQFSRAVDGYKRYKEDVKLIKDLGANSYRFSISWSRILPKGSLSEGINQEGIDHYNNLINELVKNDITPFVTLYHHDLPQALQEKYGGFLSRLFLDDFKDYSEVCFKFFGDRVKHWFTFNEPKVIAAYGYEVGISPPGRCSISNDSCVFESRGKCRLPAGPCIFGGNSSTEPYIAAHNIVLAHAIVVKLYKEKYKAQQKGELGMSLDTEYFVPYSESKEDKAAVERLFDFTLGWFMEPLLHGDYPHTMRELVKERLPTFSAREKSTIRGNLGDFVGINYYASAYAKHKPPPPKVEPRYSFDSWAEKKDIKDGAFLGVSNNHWPQGLQKLMEYMKERYQNPTIIISENGIPYPRIDALPLEVQLNDSERISSVVRHLYRTNEAIKNGVNIKGYFYWSLLDDFEWSFGYSIRYGLYYIDYNDNYKRIPKISVKWFHGFLQGNETVTTSSASVIVYPSLVAHFYVLFSCFFVCLLNQGS